MAGEKAKGLYDIFYKAVQKGYQPDKVKNGVFQAMMQVCRLPPRRPYVPAWPIAELRPRTIFKVALVNDGPVGYFDSWPLVFQFLVSASRIPRWKVSHLTREMDGIRRK